MQSCSHTLVFFFVFLWIIIVVAFHLLFPNESGVLFVLWEEMLVEVLLFFLVAFLPVIEE